MLYARMFVRRVQYTRQHKLIDPRLLLKPIYRKVRCRSRHKSPHNSEVGQWSRVPQG